MTIGDASVNFIDNSTGNITSWLWNFGDGTPTANSQTATHVYYSTGTFYVSLTVTDNNGCTDTYTDSVVVHDIFAFYIPNCFSPNGDNTNDIFLPKGLSIDPNNYKMMIFDRWGNLVFSTINLAEGWNGTYMNKGNPDNSVMGVYVYRILLNDVTGAKHHYIGHITLIP